MQNCRHFGLASCPRMSKVTTVTEMRGGRAREMKNCRRFWPRILSLHVQSVNSRRPRVPSYLCVVSSSPAFVSCFRLRVVSSCRVFVSRFVSSRRIFLAEAGDTCLHSGSWLLSGCFWGLLITAVPKPSPDETEILSFLPKP